MIRDPEVPCGAFRSTSLRSARQGGFLAALLLSSVGWASTSWASTGSAKAENRSNEHPAPGRPANVVVVVLDTLRPDHLSFCGSSRETAPRLAALAHESCVFEDAQSAAPNTAAALCSLMTSLYPEVHRVQGTQNPGRMSANVTTLAEVLRRRGYATAAFTEGAYASSVFGLDKGFQEYPPAPREPLEEVDPRLAPSRLDKNLDRTIAWLRTHARDPFFLFFHTYEIHFPYWASEEDVRLFRPGFDERADHERVAQAIERWNRERKTSAEDCLALLEHIYQCPLLGLPDLVDPEGLEKAASAFHLGPEDAATCTPLLALARDLYDASIRYTDRELERLWSALDELGLNENTIVIVASDHGEGLGQHREMQHSNVLFDEALRVLLMIRVPGKEYAPRRIPDLVRSVDVMPTVLDLVHVDHRDLPLQGSTLLPLMRGDAEPERIAFSHARNVTGGRNPQYTLRSSRWRLIEEPAVRKSWLFDLEKDPGELEDVAAAHADVVADLLRRLADQSERDRRLRERIGGSARPAEIDEVTLRELRSFGYVGEGESEGPNPGWSRTGNGGSGSPGEEGMSGGK